MDKGSLLDICPSGEERVYLLVQGILKIVEMDKNGNEMIKEIVQGGEIFGETNAYDHIESCEFGVAISQTLTYCSFSMNDFEKILIENPHLSVSYSKALGLQLKKIQKRYTSLMFNDVRTRLIYCLEDLALKNGIVKYDSVTFKNYLTHQEIASFISSTRQTVNQLFNELRKEGLIDYNRNEITLKRQLLLVSKSFCNQSTSADRSLKSLVDKFYSESSLPQ